MLMSQGSLHATLAPFAIVAMSTSVVLSLASGKGKQYATLIAFMLNGRVHHRAKRSRAQKHDERGSSFDFPRDLHARGFLAVAWILFLRRIHHGLYLMTILPALPVIPSQPPSSRGRTTFHSFLWRRHEIVAEGASLVNKVWEIRLLVLGTLPLQLCPLLRGGRLRLSGLFLYGQDEAQAKRP
jgi:hypothetical protein